MSALWSMGLYQLRIRWRVLTEVRDVARTTLLVLILTLSTLYVLNESNVSRVFLAILLLSQPVVTLAGRAIIREGFGIRVIGHLSVPGEPDGVVSGSSTQPAAVSSIDLNMTYMYGSRQQVTP